MPAKKKDTTPAPDPLSAAVGRRIAWCRTRRLELSPQELAQRVGVSPAYLWRVEDGRQNLTLRSVGRFAKALDLTLSELLDGIETGSVELENRPYAKGSETVA
ncbi:helix-turn-helix transcriptional regulator [Sphingomonadaceae bacterium OTU29THOMA1]|nr:helix-turn-helix transcriptional regulator [Sphingomonadaceae bacterium OTU29THOMA1]